MVLWRGKSPLRSPAATPWKDKAQELTPGLSLGKLGPFPTSLQPTKALGLAVELLGSLHTSLQRCSLLGNESHLTARLRIPPEVTVCVLTQKEGDYVCPKQGLCWGSGFMLCPSQATMGCLAPPAHSIPAFYPSSFFTPPRLPAPQHVLAHKQHGRRAGPPMTNMARLAVWAHRRWPPRSPNNRESTWAAATTQGREFASQRP